MVFVTEKPEVVVRPNPWQWLRYVLVGSVPPANRSWVLYDATTRTWPLSPRGPLSRPGHAVDRRCHGFLAGLARHPRRGLCRCGREPADRFHVLHDRVAGASGGKGRLPVGTGRPDPRATGRRGPTRGRGPVPRAVTSTATRRPRWNLRRWRAGRGRGGLTVPNPQQN